MENEDQDQNSFKPLSDLQTLSEASIEALAAKQKYAFQRARMMLGCYRTGEANDPETYITAIAATLMRFDEDTIKHVTHPAQGLPSTHNFLPTVAEVRKACEDFIRPQLEHKARQARIAKQLQEREEWESKKHG